MKKKKKKETLETGEDCHAVSDFSLLHEKMLKYGFFKMLFLEE